MIKVIDLQSEYNINPISADLVDKPTPFQRYMLNLCLNLNQNKLVPV